MSHVCRRRAYRAQMLIDYDLAARTQAAGCRHCGGSLHLDGWLRKPRGLGFDPTPQERTRLGLSCSRCKRRTTPPSVRFFGRKVYVAPLFLVISALQRRRRTRQLCELLGVDRRTVSRWRQWWHEAFVTTAVWTALRGQLRPTSDPPPRSLVQAFGGWSWNAVHACLRALCPLTTATDRTHDP